MTMNTLVLEHLTIKDLPPAWVKKFHPQPEQRFTVYIISETISTIYTDSQENFCAARKACSNARNGQTIK